MTPMGGYSDRPVGALTTLLVATAVLLAGVSPQFNDLGGYGQFSFSFDNTNIKTLREP